MLAKMPIRTAITSEGMRTTLVGVIGTGVSITLEQYSQLASAVAATVTAIYMAIKVWHLIRPRINKNVAKSKKTSKLR